MRKRASGELPYKARGVSLPEDVSEAVNKRLKQLRPRVKGFSHYIQLLVDWDLRGNGDPKPFNYPDHQSDGMEFAT